MGERIVLFDAESRRIGLETDHDGPTIDAIDDRLDVVDVRIDVIDAGSDWIGRRTGPSGASRPR